MNLWKFANELYVLDINYYRIKSLKSLKLET